MRDKGSEGVGTGRGGHSYTAQVSARDMQTFCPLTPGTRPWRVGCRAIAPEPQPLSGVSGYLPRSWSRCPKAAEDVAACVAAITRRDYTGGWGGEAGGRPVRAVELCGRRERNVARGYFRYASSLSANQMRATRCVQARSRGEENLLRF